MPKTKQMEQILQVFAQKTFGTDRKEAMQQATCVSCQQPAHDFRDQLSAREYKISGMCQKCQDKIFGI